jgi:hypothetical protein
MSKKHLVLLKIGKLRIVWEVPAPIDPKAKGSEQ